MYLIHEGILIIWIKHHIEKISNQNLANDFIWGYKFIDPTAYYIFDLID